MISELAKVELKPGGTGLFDEYVANISEGVPPFLGGLDAWGDGDVLPLRTLDVSAGWAGVIDEIAALSERLGVTRAVLDKLGHARSRQARFVVTGQQPGALGGPLYTLYKLSTAIAVAARLEERLGKPCIPLYWCGSDDTDFQEIRDFALLTTGLSVVSASIATEGHDAGMPVGDIDKKWIASLWQSTERFAIEHSGGERVRQLVDAAVVVSADHGELAAAVLSGLLGGRFAIVDGRSAKVRRFAKPLLLDYVEKEDAIKDDVVDTGRRLEAAGYHSQLAIGSDSGVFIVENGRRHSVAPDHRNSLLEAVHNRVESCSPGVIARNLVQDFTFEPLAVVLGPAEIAYRAQIGGVYERLGVARPAEVPRMAATFVPPPLDELLNVVGDAPRLIDDPSGFVSEAYRTLIPDVVADAALAFESDVREALDRLTQQIDKDIPDKAQGKLRGRIKEFGGRAGQLASTVRDAGKTMALGRWPSLAGLAQLIRPGEKPQERRLSSVVPFLFSSGDLADGLIGLGSSHVDELVDGRFQHVVYSVRS